MPRRKDNADPSLKEDIMFIKEKEKYIPAKKVFEYKNNKKKDNKKKKY